MKRIFISDCEGPVTKNDNAFELASHYIPDGDRLFTVISSYDDVLAEVLKRPNYKAGDTLKLILPFFKAYGVTDKKMHDYSMQSLVLIPNIKDNLRHIQEIAHTFIVSTSYEHYIQALCQVLEFPIKNVYCTELILDKYPLKRDEEVRLKQMASEIAAMSVIEIPNEAKSLGDFSETAQKTIQRLDEIFWKEIAEMEIGKIFDEVNPIGGKEKAEAVRDVVRKVGASLSDVMYVGDSITDVEAFRLVREKNGLAVSFNGNRYAVENAEIAVLSEHSIPLTIIAHAFCNFGKKHAVKLAENWGQNALIKSSVNQNMLNTLFHVFPAELPKVKIITKENMDSLAKESSEFRKKVRGEAIGGLG